MPAVLQGLRALGRCASLEHLDLSYSSVTAAGLAHLRPLRRLSSLVLVDCLRAVHPPCMMLLTELPALRALDASNNKRLDDGCLQVFVVFVHERRRADATCRRCLCQAQHSRVRFCWCRLVCLWR